MSFCTSCGAKLSDNKNFCNECGKKVLNRSGNRSPKAAQRLTKKTKIAITSIIAGFLLLFGLYKYGEYVTDKNKILNIFVEALEAEDINTLEKYLSTSDETLVVTEKTVLDLLAYLKQFPDEKEKLIQSFKQPTQTNKGSLMSNDYENEQIEDVFIRFEKRGKKYFIYDNYEFVIYPQYLYVITNYPEVKFLINNEEIFIELIDEETVLLGALLPGIYNIKGIVTTDYFNIEEEIEIHLFSETFTRLNFEIDEIYIDSFIDGASIYVNGENTMEILESDGYIFKPVLLDGSMEISFIKETPFGNLMLSI